MLHGERQKGDRVSPIPEKVKRDIARKGYKVWGEKTTTVMSPKVKVWLNEQLARVNKELENFVFETREDIMKTTAFVSGHGDLTEQEFKEHYKPRLDWAIENGVWIVVGDYKGADTMAQEYLLNCYYRRVVVFHMFSEPRVNVGNFPTKCGYKTDNHRDSAMTMLSDYDIAWVRPGREKSGTAKNIKRRAGLIVEI